MAVVFAGHLDLGAQLMWTVADALSAADCARYIAKFEGAAAEQAPVITARGVEVDLAVRNNLRVMWDDVDEANGLVERVRPPARWKTERLAGGNPRLRLYRYEPGEQHTAHWDTVVELGDGVASRLTLVFYLNDGFAGGETEFPELARVITPVRGMALVFQHRVLHAALTPASGVKYVLRTDVLYRR